MMEDKDIEEYHNLVKNLTKKTYQPLPDSLCIGDSKIHGQGLIAKEDIAKGTDLGVSHYRKGDEVIRTPLGGFMNHSESPNAELIGIGRAKYLITLIDIMPDEEITLSYTMYSVET